ncbi:TetR/AcrR family transcriptional regulator [Desertibacillus haloalkaliphilus]|uniref:TetR/AcrR family transcriptional regulator n=1 Tax=Desertibacillus haloalkaliphilus TaxID=1328930 RepID=UPI001C262697|nr:TetR/AcrR family transcriptional regulator [Desertibacillus haloalkaliphilus]MBU8908739.1 TetR/AcrR family transcriptional regulator [Desertibacillus haloalkaliphilus]
MSNQEITTKRKNRTKTHLKSALIAMIKEKGFHAVTVKDIVDKADYNRSTFYIHYQDKFELAEDLMESMFTGVEESVGKPYVPDRTISTSKLDANSFYFVSFICENRDFFELIKYEDTIPGLQKKFQQTILTIYQEKFIFETIHNIPVNMDYFTRYTAFGFYGLISNWITTGFHESLEEFIKEVIVLSKTHIQSLKYVGEK